MGSKLHLYCQRNVNMRAPRKILRFNKHIFLYVFSSSEVSDLTTGTEAYFLFVGIKSLHHTPTESSWQNKWIRMATLQLAYQTCSLHCCLQKGTLVLFCPAPAISTEFSPWKSNDSAEK